MVFWEFHLQYAHTLHSLTIYPLLCYLEMIDLPRSQSVQFIQGAFSVVSEYWTLRHFEWILFRISCLVSKHLLELAHMNFQVFLCLKPVQQVKMTSNYIKKIELKFTFSFHLRWIISYLINCFARFILNRIQFTITEKRELGFVQNDRF